MFFKNKTIRLYGKERSELRKKVFERDKGKCQECGCSAPLYDVDNQFDRIHCGHMCHIKSTGAGGEDTLENVRWLCSKCHGKEHGTRFTKNVDFMEII